jgi:hypothetical protein
VWPYPAIALSLFVLAVDPGASAGARLDRLRALPPDALAVELRSMSPHQLVALGREGVRRLGTYRARLSKRERVGGKVLPPQTIELLVRPSPPALRLEYVAGPKAGRKVVWTAKRPNQMHVREAGILGVMSVWLDVDGRLARGDTNHAVTELGFAPLLDLIAGDLLKAEAHGGHHRRDEGFDATRRYCMVFTAPAGAQDLYAQRTRLCVDPRLAVPVEIEAQDRAGFLEHYRYTDVRSEMQVADDVFDEL